MYAMLVDKDATLNWAEVPDPLMKPDEVLINIRATALNRADLLQRQGKYPPPPGAPEYMGLEAAGTIARIGEDVPVSVNGHRWSEGDNVCLLLPGGGYAEKVSVRPELLLPIPAGLSMQEAASLPEVFATSWLNLVIEANLKAGETVLIHAGASGLGIAAIQLAKMLGAKVITTVGSEEKAAKALSFGANIVVNRHTDDITTVLERCRTEGHPVNVALDCVGGMDLGVHLSKLAPGGRWILIATLGGESSEVPLRPLLIHGLRLIGSTLRNRPLEVKARIIRELTRTVWPEIEAGRIRPVIHQIFPIGEVEKAHGILERQENVGKVVLNIA